jgi:Leucine Rich repeat
VVLRNLVVGNNNIFALDMNDNSIGPGGAIGLGHGLFAGITRLQKFYLQRCNIGNDGVADLVLPAGDDGMMNSSLTDLDLSLNSIEGAAGGRHKALLLLRLPSAQ